MKTPAIIFPADLLSCAGPPSIFSATLAAAVPNHTRSLHAITK
ncbi:hypothetical protein [Cupriavidus necator]|nr:hypothetical protein [Cupriavidus necator]